MAYRVSNRVLSGPYAHLNGHKITWEESLAPADPACEWRVKVGKVVCVGASGQHYFVDIDGLRYWISEITKWQRNIVVE